MKKRFWQLLSTMILCLGSAHFSSAQEYLKVNISDSLHIEQISPTTYVHTSYIQIKGYGGFPSNGLIYVVDGAAIVFDTPVYKKDGDDLIEWLKYDLKVDIKAVVINHFHDDCLGSLKSFHTEGIPSLANKKTIELAQKQGNPVPQIGFDQDTVLVLNSKEIICHFPGEAHTVDNIVAYIPQDKVLFGGCMIKRMGARKGNLSDANVKEWSRTVRKVTDKFPETEIAVPGHGGYGGQELFRYTMGLFAPPRPRD